MLAHLRDGKFLHATSVLVGTMVGVGIFGVPFAFAKAGFWVGSLWLLGLAAAVCVFDLLFAEVTLATKGAHQLVGYASAWLGPWGRRAMTLFQVLSLYGALLAYLIVSGEFLHNVFSNVISIDPQWYAVIFALFWAPLWIARLKTIASVELTLVGLYAAIVVIIVALGVPHIELSNFTEWTSHFWYLPYGVLLFAFAGMSSIPIQRRLLSGREHLFRPAIITAVAITALTYLIFAAVVVGVSGSVTSPEAFSGLFGFLGEPVLILGSLLGIFTISTSYVLLGTALYETFHIDYRVRMFPAWLLALLPPLALFWSGLRNFIDVIDMIGAVAIGAISVLLLGAYLRAKKGKNVVGVVLLMAVFAAGVVYTLFIR